MYLILQTGSDLHDYLQQTVDPVGGRVRYVDNGMLSINEAGLAALGRLDEDCDGHYDGESIWVGGDPIRVVRDPSVPADEDTPRPPRPTGPTWSSAEVAAELAARDGYPTPAPGVAPRPSGYPTHDHGPWGGDLPRHPLFNSPMPCYDLDDWTVGQVIEAYDAEGLQVWTRDQDGFWSRVTRRVADTAPAPAGLFNDVARPAGTRLHIVRGEDGREHAVVSRVAPHWACMSCRVSPSRFTGSRRNGRLCIDFGFAWGTEDDPCPSCGLIRSDLVYSVLLPPHPGAWRSWRGIVRAHLGMLARDAPYLPEARRAGQGDRLVRAGR